MEMSFTLYFWLLLASGKFEQGQIYHNSQKNCDENVKVLTELFKIPQPETGLPVFTMISAKCLPTY